MSRPKCAIGYFADGPWGQHAFRKILDHPDLSVKFVVPRFDTQDPVICEMARQHDIPIHIEPNVNQDAFLDTVRSYQPDLLVSMSFNQILKREILEIPPKGFINCHAGALPFYRGRNPLNWVLINGEKQFGITVHYIDAGIDTGDIIVQNMYAICDADDYGTLIQRASLDCATVLLDALQKIIDDTVVPTPQTHIHPVGFYCNQRLPGDEQISWSWPAKRIHDFIRGITLPGPGARTSMDTKTYAMIASDMIQGAPSYMGIDGAVVGVMTGRGIVVKTGDSSLLITKMAEVVDGVFMALQTPFFKIGTRFR